MSTVIISPKRIYTVRNHAGAHVVRAVREVKDASGKKSLVADVLQIGAQMSYTVPLTHVQPWTASAPRAQYREGYDLLAALAQEAVLVYGLDPERVLKAVEIVRGREIIIAHYDAEGNRIPTPSLDTLAVRGAHGWYTTTRGACTCMDHRTGHVCKHRIAAWMYRELILRPEAAVRERIRENKTQTVHA